MSAPITQLEHARAGTVTPEMEIAREEVFGPVMLLMRTRNDEHAVQIANDVSYGLSSSVFSKSRERARKIVEDLETYRGLRSRRIAVL